MSANTGTETDHTIRSTGAAADDADGRSFTVTGQDWDHIGQGLSGVHYPNDAGRELHVCYELTSLTHRRRIRLEVSCPDSDPAIPSVTATYPTADWQERETYDFFGVVFTGHPGLTRIEMPDDWPGHPQRKDYPLGGVPVEYKGATIPPVDTRRAYS